MKRTLSVLVAGYLLSTSAAAEELVPSARVSFAFGGKQSDLRMQLAANTWLDIDESGSRLLPYAAVEFGPGFDAFSSFLGVPMLSVPAMSTLEGEEEGSGNTWLWIGAGVVGAAAVAALAGGGGSDTEVNENTASGNTTQCGVGGSVLNPDDPPTISTDC